MVEPNGKNENITSGSTHTGIEICDADIDLAQIFPASAIKSLLRNEDGLGAEGARVYSDAADLLCKIYKTVSSFHCLYSKHPSEFINK